MYHVQGWNTRELAGFYGVNRSCICRVMKKMGIPRRPRARFGKWNGMYKHGKRSRLYLKIVCRERCAECESRNKDELVVHHKDGDRDNNRRENLLVVCRGCHNRIHKGIGVDRRYPDPPLRLWFIQEGRNIPNEQE